ncbi:hypothetical protein AAG747_10795 [Rapidithrix thailandica]|uniref:Tetratricopeptide repeat protein n=1 Tax=Rapidithrix thailandica TaxID=413964 RepID=A0AAW9S7L1_9BACT
MKKYIYSIALAASLSGCSFLNPTEVTNPNVTDEVFVDNPNAAASWLNGMRRQLALTLNQTVVLGELTSDNYYNNRTQSSKVFDIPQIISTDVDVNTLQATVQKLREMGYFGIETVAPKDAATTDDMLAEMYFLRGIASMFCGEYFVGLPGSALSEIMHPEQHLHLAIADFEKAMSLSDDVSQKTACLLAMARSYYHMGDKTNAVKYAEDVLVADPMYIKEIGYDGVNGVSNSMQFFLFDSSNDEFAPLPRLDFLDPKYYSIGNPDQDQKPVALLKAEEAYFILAEAALADNQLEKAKTQLKNLLQEVIAQRPTASIDDSKETRSGGNRTDYPLTDDYWLKTNPDAPARTGFILDRQKGNVTIPVVSGTSVTAVEIDAATTVDELLETLYLMRQEVFLAEGRRVIDLGIKYPVSDIEYRNNSNVQAEHIRAQIPDFIPGNRELDDFTNDVENKQITLTIDMNKVLVENKTNPAVVPFF